MTKLLFGQSYYLRFDPKLWAEMRPYPPLGTLYAASFLRENGFEVALFDAMLAESEAEWDRALQDEQPDFAVIYEDNFNYLSKMCLGRMREAADRMIADAIGRNIPVIVCGADASDHPDHYLAKGASYVIVGEGEVTLLELVSLLQAAPLDAMLTEQLGQVAGLVFSAETGLVNTGRRADIKAVDSLPFPAWDLVDVDRYRNSWLANHGYYSVNMVTTRGCPYHCNWCAKPIWGQRYNARSAENVADELAWLKETIAPDHIWFADDIMGLTPNWWQTYANLIEQRDLKIPFKCLSRADLLLRSEDEIEAMARAGCQIVWIGAESGSQKILDAMDKGTTVEQIRAVVPQLQQHGIAVGFFLQFGYPGETEADIELTLQLVREVMPDDVGMSVSYPLPGTPFYDRVSVEMGEKQHWDDSADMAMLYQGPMSTAYYRQLHSVLHKEFRSRKAIKQLGNISNRDRVATVYRLLTLPFARRKLRQLAVSAQS